MKLNSVFLTHLIVQFASVRLSFGTGKGVFEMSDAVTHLTKIRKLPFSLLISERSFLFQKCI